MRAPTRARPILQLGGLAAAARRASIALLCAILPIAGLIYVIVLANTNMGRLPFPDFRIFLAAGHDVLAGRSPYPLPDSSVLAHENSFVYPAPAALLMVPFALLPYPVASNLFILFLVASILAALFVLGVRDWRCYGVALLAGPVMEGVSLGAITPLLVLGLALCWRYRDRTWPAAAALAALIVLKIFLWPLLIWFAVTKRLRTAAASAGLIVVTTLGAWAVLGFRGFLEYPHVMSLLTKLLEGKGYSLIALGRSLGSTPREAEALAFAVGGVLLVAVAVRGRRSGTEWWTFVASLGAAFALSPIIWTHYFALLFVPIAIVSPRLAPLWFAPLTLSLVPGQSDEPPVWQHEPARNLALTPRVGHASFILYAVVVVSALLLLVTRRHVSAELRLIRRTKRKPRRSRAFGTEKEGFEPSRQGFPHLTP